MRRHHPQAFTGRPAEALNGQAQSLNSSHPTIAAELAIVATMGLLIICAIWMWDSFFGGWAVTFLPKIHVGLLQGWPPL